MALTAEQLLDVVETAITEILTDGQSWALGGRRKTMADLPELRRMRNELKAEARGGIVVQVAVPR